MNISFFMVDLSFVVGRGWTGETLRHVFAHLSKQSARGWHHLECVVVSLGLPAGIALHWGRVGLVLFQRQALFWWANEFITYQKSKSF